MSQKETTTPEVHQELNLEELAEHLANITAKVVQEIRPGQKHPGAEFINLLSSKILNKLDTELTQDELVISVLELLEYGAKLTPMEADDKLVDMAQRLHESFKVSTPFIEWLKQIREMLNAKRKERKAKREERQAANKLNKGKKKKRFNVG